MTVPHPREEVQMPDVVAGPDRRPALGGKTVAAAVSVLVLVTALFTGTAAAQPSTYESDVVLNVSPPVNSGSVTNALQVLLPAVSASVGARPGREQIASAAGVSGVTGWSIDSATTAGTGLMTITVVADSAAGSQRLAAAAVPVASSAATTFSDGAVVRTISPAREGTSRRTRTVLSALAAGLALGLVLALAIYYAGRRLADRKASHRSTRRQAPPTQPADTPTPAEVDLTSSSYAR